MTPQEHELLALKMKLLAQENVLNWLADLWRLRVGASPPELQKHSLAAMASLLRERSGEYSTLTIPWLDAVNSDLQTGLFQEAFDEISKKVMDRIAAGITPDELTSLQAAAAKGQPPT